MKFKIGDIVVCICGCKPITPIIISQLTDSFVVGYHVPNAIGSREQWLLEINIKKINDLTKLERLIYNLPTPE